jgi:hypothetical protein
MTLLRFLLIIILSVSMISCNLEQTAQRYENLPRATGKAGEIIVVMDSAMWQGNVGLKLRSTFGEIVPTIPRQEPMFSLNHIAPRDFQSFLKRQKNVMFVTVLGDNSKGNRILRSYFTNESLQMIEDDPSIFMYSKKDEFARGQEIMHLFGQTADVLIKNIDSNKDKLLDHYLKVEEDRLYSALYSAKYEQGISNHIKSKLGCELKVPLGFEIGLEDDSFIWLRSFSPDVDKSIFISWKDYSSEEMFSLDSLLLLRTELSRPHILYKPEDPESFLLTETDNFDIFRKEINFNGLYAVELKGLWKLNKYYMGGPFISYALVDESTNRLYYIEAFLYSPGQPQRDVMRELGTILKTFRVAGMSA